MLIAIFFRKDNIKSHNTIIYTFVCKAANPLVTKNRIIFLFPFTQKNNNIFFLFDLLERIQFEKRIAYLCDYVVKYRSLVCLRL